MAIDGRWCPFGGRGPCGETQERDGWRAPKKKLGSKKTKLGNGLDFSLSTGWERTAGRTRGRHSENGNSKTGQHWSAVVACPILLGLEDKKNALPLLLPFSFLSFFFFFFFCWLLLRIDRGRRLASSGHRLIFQEKLGKKKNKKTKSVLVRRLARLSATSRTHGIRNGIENSFRFRTIHSEEKKPLKVNPTRREPTEMTFRRMASSSAGVGFGKERETERMETDFAFRHSEELLGARPRHGLGRFRHDCECISSVDLEFSRYDCLELRIGLHSQQHVASLKHRGGQRNTANGNVVGPCISPVDLEFTQYDCLE